MVSWTNAVEGFLAIVALQAAVNRFVKKASQNPEPVRWTKDSDETTAAV